MTDKATVGIKSKDGTIVYFFTNWSGHQLPSLVACALRRGQRWLDAPYLARIIFCEMASDYWDGETGFGISASPHMETNYWPFIVDVGSQNVEIGYLTMTFTEFCNFAKWPPICPG